MSLRILNWQDGSSAAVQRLDAESLPSVIVNGLVNPDIISLFENGEQIFILGRFTEAVILTSTDLEGSGDSFYISEAVSRTAPTGWLQAAVEASNVPDVQVLGTRGDWFSPDGRFTAGEAGIFDAATEQLVAPSYRLKRYCLRPEMEFCFPDYHFCCWLPDSSGAIYTFDSTIIGSSMGIPFNYDVGAPGRDEGVYWMPVLKVRVPEDS
jgi:hypothetical protein